MRWRWEVPSVRPTHRQHLLDPHTANEEAGITYTKGDRITCLSLQNLTIIMYLHCEVSNTQGTEHPLQSGYRRLSRDIINELHI